MKATLQRPFVVLNQQRKHKVHSLDLQTFLDRLSTALGISERDFAVALVTDNRIRRFNRQYRGFDKATDVLSFHGADSYLGDILISTETAFRQAGNSRTLTFERNLHRLMLHGLLHLMGYDHETDNGEMREIERRFRRRFKC
jgi:probable rRNA maturation factor